MTCASDPPERMTAVMTDIVVQLKEQPTEAATEGKVRAAISTADVASLELLP